MTATTRCQRCRGSKPAWAAVCWRCHLADQVRTAREAGYRAGWCDGQRATSFADSARLRQLIQLCHPDRHAGSPAATDATCWLLERKRALEVHS